MTDESSKGASEATTHEPLMVGSKEAARLLGMSERSLWTLTDAKSIPCIRIAVTGRSGASARPRKFYELAELRAFVERMREASQ